MVGRKLMEEIHLLGNYKLFFDNWYVKNINFFLDFSIILKTVVKVLKKESINLTNEISMEPFKGTKNKD